MHRVAGKIMADFISLRNLRFHAFHGVLPQERKVGNDYRLSLRVEYPLEKAMESDDVNDTLSYAEVLDIVKYEMNIPSALLENVAYRIGRHLLEAFSEIRSVHIELIKLNPPMGADGEGAGIELHLINDKTR